MFVSVYFYHLLFLSLSLSHSLALKFNKTKCKQSIYKIDLLTISITTPVNAASTNNFVNSTRLQGKIVLTTIAVVQSRTYSKTLCLCKHKTAYNVYNKPRLRWSYLRRILIFFKFVDFENIQPVINVWIIGFMLPNKTLTLEKACFQLLGILSEISQGGQKKIVHLSNLSYS